MSETTPAVVYRKSLPISDPEALLDVQVERPVARPNDLIVRVEAVSVNPVDIKQRTRVEPPADGRVLGFDASGTVVEVGRDVSLFAPGDEVYYAGSINRPGTNVELHAVDERIVGRKPTHLSHAEAASVPLTAITAWECLFDRLQLTADSEGTILVIGGAGGVGSQLIQFAKKLTKLTVIATASRPESSKWVSDLGADHVVDHSGDLAAAVLHVAPEGVEYVFSAHTHNAIPTFARIIKPFGHVVAIDESEGLNIMPLKGKAIAWHWESMFTRPIFGTPDMIEQHHLLDRVADLIDDGTIRHALTTTLMPLNAEQIREGHRLVETGRMIGKVVVSRN